MATAYPDKRMAIDPLADPDTIYQELPWEPESVPTTPGEEIRSTASVSRVS